MEENTRDSSIGMRKSLGELLVAEQIISREQLEGALKLQRRDGGQLSDVLVKQKLIKPEDLAAILSVQLNVPYISLQRHKVQPAALRLIPEEIARKHTLIPLDVVGDSIVVVMADPQDVQTIQDIKTQVKMKVDVALGIPSDIRQAIDLNYRAITEIEKQVLEFAPLLAEETKTTQELAAWTPIAQTVDMLITQAVRDRASDIHIEPQVDRLRVRYRIDGVLRDMFSFPRNVHVPLVSRIKIMAEMNIAEQRRPQDGQIVFNIGEKEIDIRVSSLPTSYGERLALRILDKALSLFTLPELGLLPDNLKKFDTMIKSPYGLILVGGPTGSGKTTTLYALINSLNRIERNIMTVEDPVEYKFTNINQTQVNPKAGVTFADGLRTIMRHDPNIILIGEIRDKETATIGIQAALTGHLVMSSIHANNTVGILFRLIDLGIEPYLLVSTLVGVSAQRMVRRMCPHCRAIYQPPGEELAIYDEEVPERPDKFYTRGAGCNLCNETGYQGRTGLFEIMLMSDNIRRMIINNTNAVDIRTQALQEGMISMRKDGMLKVKQGVTSMDEVLRSVFSVG